ncbi:hypothetical protein ZEAMMB73_Zm00001d020271 [Zea mays]|uniref:DNA/RNA-binding protein Alba-like domain-containing protein n=1 Tax=Zea mays TaxID=4577 RepID=A0A1D6I3A5_MAIZE|nr:hypothetical protein ZEAMMB73_Zm00001d020271 [Zea mays]
MLYFLKDKGSDEVVLKAMGRAINKIVMTVELIKISIGRGWDLKGRPVLLFYTSYPAGTEMLTNTAKLYKAALGNCFETDDIGC